MDGHAVFEVLEVGNHLEIFLEFAVDLGKEVDFDHVEALAQLVHLSIHSQLAAFGFVSQLGVEVFKIAEIEDVVFFEVAAFHFLVAS